MSKLAKKLIQKEMKERTGYLELGNCGLTDLEKQVPELFELEWLETLILSNSWFDFKSKELIKSQNKGSRNHLNALPLGLSRLQKLIKLVVEGDDYMDLKWDIIKIENLPKTLNQLYISRNQIQKLENLPEGLSLLDIRYNYIKKIDPSLAFLKNGNIKLVWNHTIKPNNFIVSENPFESPPVEIVKQGREAVLTYFKSLQKDSDKGIPKHYLKEIKILLVGEGMAGKTSLLKKIKALPFKESESQTHGVNIEALAFEEVSCWKNHESLKGVTGRFWDFGGQEIMHASHRFFLTSRSVYLLVLDSRTDRRKHYWLQHIQKFGGKSPVIVLMNKMDENPNYSLEEKTLNEKYPFIENRFIKFSCKSGRGFEDLQRELAKLIPETELFKTPISQAWLNVKKQLEVETDEHKYIDRKQFLKICEAEEVTDKAAQNTLLTWLNELGIVLHFKNLGLRKFYVLDPHWVTIGVYKIINSHRILGGMLKEKDLEYILNEEITKKKDYDPSKEKTIRYDEDEMIYLVSIMEQFELLYKIKEDIYLIPDLLPKEPKQDIEFDRTEALQFVMEYDFLHNSVMSRFFIDMKGDIWDYDQLWRTGVVLRHSIYNCTALVQADLEAKRISIAVNGESQRKRDYFSAIYHKLCVINESFEGLQITEYIPLPDAPEELVKYKHLLGHEKEGLEKYFHGETGQFYSVAELLDGVFSREQRMRGGRKNINLQ